MSSNQSFLLIKCETPIFGANPGCLHERVSTDPALLLISRPLRCVIQSPLNQVAVFKQTADALTYPTISRCGQSDGLTLSGRLRLTGSLGIDQWNPAHHGQQIRPNRGSEVDTEQTPPAG